MTTTESSLDPRLLTLLDKDEIRELLFRFAEAADRKLWQTWEDCFTEDAYVSMPFATHEGRDGLKTWAEAALAPFETTEHLYGNIQISIDGDTATGRNNFWAACTQSRSDLARHFDEGGSYSWQFARTESGWRISRLDLDVTWTAGADEAGLSG